MFKGTTTKTIRMEAIKNGMSTLYADGMLKVIRGITTFEEVYRVAKTDRAGRPGVQPHRQGFGLAVGRFRSRNRATCQIRLPRPISAIAIERESAACQNPRGYFGWVVVCVAREWPWFARAFGGSR